VLVFEKTIQGKNGRLLEQYVFELLQSSDFDFLVFGLEIYEFRDARIRRYSWGIFDQTDGWIGNDKELQIGLQCRISNLGNPSYPYSSEG
jgi:hypothetical protein